ncbi:TonB-dependent receptor [Lysobacter concretionis Ko07 = DSM 16239]|uniref:TonB-dependent receptor n=1 Tax=Lysobacter concretionis Ko07 = DSM 16239 TaxID=1122185 RepID=A0A0A0ELD1_9GAMM|nr:MULTISPECIES: TonB-dependent receptor [Lysobacter]KGM51110.1 TonB-dependent receptor [Lysobacter concretionis Ko07 = DSM 16239]QOD90911.1 TonB-dependent receptor [Lysobacter sp. CW239]
MNAPRRHPLAKAVSLCLLIGLPLLAAAQEPSTPTDQTRRGATTLDSIQVTGTRIRKAEIETQTPVQTLTREDIERTGLTSIGDILQELTGSGSALNTKFNSSGNFGFSPNGDGVGAGSAQVDLRNLGPKRVLVLVDGMRWVNEASASGVGAATDLNTIPLALIERIDVLEDGASSLYGSDAIGGVVNIITRRNFEGGQVTLNYGQYGEGDGTQKGADIAWGFNTDRSNLFVGISHVDQEEILSKTRAQSRFPVPGTGLTFASSGTPNGRFIFFPGTASSACPLTDVDDNPATAPVPFCNITTPNGSSYAPIPAYPGDFIGFGTANRFNFSEYNMLLTPSERTGVFGQYRFYFNDKVHAYAKALYNRRESTNQAAPEPIFLGPDAGTGNPYADDITIPGSHPYNPFDIDLVSSGPGANLVLIGRRPVEGGARVYEQKVDTKYFAAGLEGSFGNEQTFFWDINVATSENEAEQTNYGSYNIRNIALALGDTDSSGATCAGTPGCVPLNIFGGPGTITPEMLAWIQPVVRDRSEQSLDLVTANLSGDLFDLWAGPVSFAAGAEHRRYEGSYTPDPINYVTMPDGSVESHYNGVPSLPTAGKYDVSEAYVELNVPLIREGTFGKSLDLSLAGRYSDYSTFGSQFTPKYGLRWQVADELLLRATYAEGFRAPSIGELFGSASRGDLQIDDPCLVGLDGSPPTGSAANCAALGVPPGSAQSNSQISVTTGGNPDLDPETARSFSAGLVFSPAFASGAAWSDRLDFELTFYRHSLEGAVQAIDAQTQLDLCVETLNPLYCDGITRSSVGSINGFNNRLTNLGSIKTDGWDADVFWTLPETAAGRFKLSWQNTIVTRYEAVGAAGQVQPRGVGIEVTDSAIPEWTSTANLDWRRDNWNASWSVRHISELEEQCGDAVSFPVCSDPAKGTNTLDAITYHDLQLGYRIEWFKGLQLTAGANNVFDKDPPICLSCSLNGYDASTYDIPGGRYFYLRADLRF